MIRDKVSKMLWGLVFAGWILGGILGTVGLIFGVAIITRILFGV